MVLWRDGGVHVSRCRVCACVHVCVQVSHVCMCRLCACVHVCWKLGPGASKASCVDYNSQQNWHEGVWVCELRTHVHTRTHTHTSTSTNTCASTHACNACQHACTRTKLTSPFTWPILQIDLPPLTNRQCWCSVVTMLLNLPLSACATSKICKVGFNG